MTTKRKRSAAVTRFTTRASTTDKEGVVQDAPTAPQPRDANGYALDEWGLPLVGPARLRALAAIDKPDPRDAPDAWSDAASAGGSDTASAGGSDTASAGGSAAALVGVPDPSPAPSPPSPSGDATVVDQE